jgi:hypothetical protein
MGLPVLALWRACQFCARNGSSAAICSEKSADVIHVGNDEHGGGMLEKAVRHLVERETDILQADLLADDVEGDGGELLVHLPHDAGEHRAIAHAGIEQAQRGRLRRQVGQFQPDAPRYDLLLRAGVDEQQILLPVVEEAEVLFLGCSSSGGLGRSGKRVGRTDEGLQLGRRGRGDEAAGSHERLQPLQRLGGDPGTVAQPRDELAVVDRPAPERALRHLLRPAELGDGGKKVAPWCSRVGGGGGLICGQYSHGGRLTRPCGERPAKPPPASAGKQPQTSAKEEWDNAHNHGRGHARRNVTTSTSR